MNNKRLVGVRCGCCRSFDKTVNLPLVGDYRRKITVWRCSECGEACSNSLCDGFQSAVFEEGSR